jgi:hypothetical protein
VNVGYLTQNVVDTLREPGDYYDGDATRLELFVGANGRLRQYRVRSGMGVSRSAERVGAASMYSLKQARARATRILAELAAGEADRAALDRKRAQASENIGGFFDSWASARQAAR